jgi:hypothetical protein
MTYFFFLWWRLTELEAPSVAAKALPPIAKTRATTEISPKMPMRLRSDGNMCSFPLPVEVK